MMSSMLACLTRSWRGETPRFPVANPLFSAFSFALFFLLSFLFLQHFSRLLSVQKSNFLSALLSFSSQLPFKTFSQLSLSLNLLSALITDFS
jgi:hypothetical protein